MSNILDDTINQYLTMYSTEINAGNISEIIIGTGFFNGEWYKKQYPDVDNAKIDPALHFVKYGFKQKRMPSEKMELLLACIYQNLSIPFDHLSFLEYLLVLKNYYLANLVEITYLHSLTNLDSLAIKYGTDKSSKWHDFTSFYQRILGERRVAIKGLIELGIGMHAANEPKKWGASLKMWRDWLPNAKIVGVDIRKELKIDFGDRITVIIANQNSKSGLDRALEASGGEPDVIIDDCSHTNVYTISSFEYLFPFLAPGGVYIIEDTSCSIIKWHNYHELETFVINLMRALSMNYRTLIAGFCEDFSKIDSDLTMNIYERWVERIEMRRGIIAIYKRSR